MVRGIMLLLLIGVVVMNDASASHGDHGPRSTGVDSIAAKIEVATRANNAFALALYSQLVRELEGENIFWSPFSMSSALAIAAEGARAETADEMGKTLGYPQSLHRTASSRAWDLEPIHAGFSGLSAALRPMTTGEVDQYEMRVATALWGEQTYRFRREFIDVIDNYYGTGSAAPVDFKHDPEAQRRRINRWVEEQTNDRIRDLLPAGSVDEWTRLVLTNAIYFMGEWTEPFDSGNTTPKGFTLASGTAVQTPMMTDVLGSARYAAFEADGSFYATPLEIPMDAADPKGPGAKGFAMVELPYKGDQLSMLLVAPNRADRLPAIESNLAAGRLDEWVGHLEERAVHVILPRFKLEATYEMKTTLQALGMVRAFEPPSAMAGAQFDGMSESSDPDDRLFIWDVFHKAFVEVNEKGTEAAAATAIPMACESAIVETRPHVPTFRADRPFLFAIRHMSTGALLFIGRMMRPE